MRPLRALWTATPLLALLCGAGSSAPLLAQPAAENAAGSPAGAVAAPVTQPAVPPAATAPAAQPAAAVAPAQPPAAAPAVSEPPSSSVAPAAASTSAPAPSAERAESVVRVEVGPASPGDAEAAAQTPPRDSLFDAGHGTLGDVSVGLGAFLDVVDPRAAAGISARVPQLTLDGRFGLGRGFSAIAHLNTILAISELTAGAAWSFPLVGELRGMVQLTGGMYLGMLGGFGYDSRVIAPEYRPLVGVSLPMGAIRWSLRTEVVFAGPYFTKLGDTKETLATPPPVANWNVTLMLENLMANGRLWYLGLSMMGSTAAYQNWLLFPDTDRYDYYARLSVGYEF